MKCLHFVLSIRVQDVRLEAYDKGALGEGIGLPNCKPITKQPRCKAQGDIYDPGLPDTSG